MISMAKKSTLCLGLASLLLTSMALSAQNPTKYIKWSGENDKFYQAYNAWSAGQPLYPNAAEDENFFISRVKYRERFANRNVQANPSITDDNEKKVINWVPIGTTDNGNPNALPSGIFDSDVFSMWNTITHYGNWTAPLVRMPGAFMDVAHKNGVSTSVLSSIPWDAQINSLDGSHGQTLASIFNGGSDKFLKLLKQYGIDGWGINSEFNTNSSFVSALQNFMKETFDKAVTQKQWPQYAMVWYTLVNNNGKVSPIDGVSEANRNWFAKDGKQLSNYQFGNYNWGASQLATNQRIAGEEGITPFDIYAGMNLQGAEGTGWTLLKDYKTSIGLWGAHNMNMFYESRNEDGSSPLAMQKTYLQRTERFFGNGAQNPAKVMTVRDGLGIGKSWLKNFHGISAFVTAKSVLQWNLDDAPFYTFFNIGNGQYFNIEGNRVYDNEWYNIGMQDYLPTWRYWFADSYLGRDVSATGLEATVSWDDAWFGGSSLEISGTNDRREYLHLFKTKFELKDGDRIRVRLKVVSGSTSIRLAASAVGTERTMQAATLLRPENIDLDEWQELTVTVGSGLGRLRLAGSTMAALALEFTNTENLVLRVGEVSISRGAVAKPAKPIINESYTKAYNYTFKGIDGKVIFEMPRPASVPSPNLVYNDDVQTAFFKIYAQQEGQPAKFITATTSWASLILNAPFDRSGTKRVRFGVSAVGLDGITEGDIAWSAYRDAGEQEISDKIVFDKPVIKPGQDFTLSFEDPGHVAGNWEITDASGRVLHSVSNVQSLTTNIDNVGIYNLKVTWMVDGSAKTSVLPGFVQISDNTVGAFPEIKTLTFNGSSDATVSANVNQRNNLAYTGRPADGKVSRGLLLEEKPFGVRASEVGLTTLRTSWSLGFWVKFNSIPAGSVQLMTIRNPAGRWPTNNWGTIWATYEPATGEYHLTRRYGPDPGPITALQVYHARFVPGVWTHITYTFELDNNGRTHYKFYINGKHAEPKSYKNGSAQGNGLDPQGQTGYWWDNNNYLLIGGPAAGRAGIDGVIDDVKFFKVALTADEVLAEMTSGVPTRSGSVGYWSFEREPESDGSFANVYTGADATVAKLCRGEFVAGNGEGVNRFSPIRSRYEAGSPFVPGTAFDVTTKPKWTFSKGTVVPNAASNSEAGTATVTYARTGAFTGKLTLENSWGAVSKTIEVINVADPSGVELPESVLLQAFPNPFVERVHVRFAEAGQYQLAIYDLSGTLVERQYVDAEAGGVVAVQLNAAPGTYLLRVATLEGKLLQALKLQKR